MPGAVGGSARNPLKIVALPRAGNPYQQLLYGELEREGHRVRYAGRLTPSQTLNVLLLPLELALWRAAGWRILHLHWTFAFKLTGSDRFPLLRRANQHLFDLALAATRVLGIRVIWTAHNVLPHEPGFHDELAARRRLARVSDLVLVHSQATLEALERAGITPRRTAVVTVGPMAPSVDVATLRQPGSDDEPLKLLFFGQVLGYKGVEDLLEAVRGIPQPVRLTLTVAGACPHAELAGRLARQAAQCGHPVRLRLEHIPESEVTDLMSKTDVVVLPFRSITTSGSVVLAMGYGRAVVVPDLPSLADLPGAAVVRYDGSVAGLRRTLVEVATWPSERLRRLGAAASEYVGTLSWSDAARQTLSAIRAMER
jgi:glycosyltransferase involved in cell wall biosynthesis